MAGFALRCHRDLWSVIDGVRKPVLVRDSRRRLPDPQSTAPTIPDRQLISAASLNEYTWPTIKMLLVRQRIRLWVREEVTGVPVASLRQIYGVHES